MLLLAVSYSLILSYSCTTINELIYRQVDFDEVRCIRMNNRNSQIGCQTGRDGDTGVLYLVQNTEDVDKVQDLSLPPIIAVVPASLFTNQTVEGLRRFTEVNGVIVLEDEKPSYYSPDKKCPNEGFNVGENASMVLSQSCSGQKWNPKGNWLSYLDLSFGVFLIKNKTDIAFMKEKAASNVVNNALKSYPLWSGEMKSFMQSAVDTPTCMRRGTCDPIGGRNVVVNLLSAPTLIRPQRVLVCVKADAVAYFHDMSYGGEANAAGLVTQFAIMDALSKARDDGLFASSSTDVMFAFFQGESFDYVGSQRMAYDLSKGTFKEGGTNISLANFEHIIEIGHVGLYNSKYYTHFSSQSSADTAALRNRFLDEAVNLTFANSSSLPPSSINSFLREDESVSAIVISDGEMEFTTNYFGSRFDTLVDADRGTLSARLADLATTVSRVVYKVVGGQDLSSKNITADVTLVDDLLECYLVTQNCSMFRSILNVTSIPNKKLNRYSSVSSHLTVSNQYIYGVAARLSKKDLDLPEEKCNSSYTGYKVSFSDGTCYGHATNYTAALSPAFVLKDYASTRYSTWTESRWSPVTKLRLFEVSSRSEGTVIFVVGLLYFVFTSLILIQCVRRKDLIFSDLEPVT